MGKEPKDIKAIFSDAIEKQIPEERAAYLDEVCGEDAQLRSKVEGLLKAHQQAGSFLEIQSVDSNVTIDGPSQIEGPGTKIGRYELLELIGEGGMGLVYLAEQKEPVKRKVALKIVKLGMDTKQVVARFEAERQALALLEHPNIAHVFDAGTTENGRPYFVMEYVKGMSITIYCDEYKLNIEQRLRLFEQVCEAIHHAHQKGIIHRDIKPSNILVSMHGDRAVPKIIDFGIAKAITQPLTDKTFVTFQGQLLGTPEYMSPEQVDLAVQDIDTRSDIYALGVVLYELLAGVLPFERESLAHLGFAEVQRTIREQEPASPSIRLTKLGEQAKTIAASRGTQLIALARRLHRELEWIPLKAMRKDRCRRYRSASEMADDIHNYLNGRPLIAGPETAVYRVKKFVHKHAGSVATVVLVAAAIILGLIASTAMYLRAEDARKKEVIARTQAEQANKKEALARKQAEQAEQATKEKAEDLRRTLYVNSIQLADAKYHEGNTRRVRELLESCPKDLRGWEWDRLNYVHDVSIMTLSGASGESIIPVLGKDDCIHAAMLDPDGKRIVSGHLDGTIRVWDSATGEKLKEFHAHNQPLWSMAASSDGRFVVSGSSDKTIKVWDTETFEESKTLLGHEGPVGAVVVSPNTDLIVSLGGGEKVLRVWDVQSGSELMTIGDKKTDFECIVFSPDGKDIISGDNAGDIKIWDSATGEMLLAIHAHPDSISCVKFNLDGSKIASAAGWDGQIKVWDSKTGIHLASFHGDKEQDAEAIAFSPDDKYIVFGLGNLIKIFEIETGSELKTLSGHEAWLTSLAFTRDGKRIISSSWDGTVRLWDISRDHEATRLTVAQHPLYSISMTFSPDCKRIATNTDGMVKIWDTVSCVELMTLHRPVAQPHRKGNITFSADGRLIGTTIPGGMIKIWDADTNTEVMKLQVPEQQVLDLAFSPDNKRLVTAGMIPIGLHEAKGVIKIWNISDGKEIMALPLEEPLIPYSVTFSPDGKNLVSGFHVIPNRQGGDVKERGAVKVWDLSSGTEIMTMTSQDGPVFCVAFSPDCKLIASGNHIVTAKVWDAATGTELMTLNGHDGAVISIAFSPDGRRIVTGSDDKTVRVWDVATGAEILDLSCDSVVHCATFNSNGTVIAAGTVDGTLFIWDSNVPSGRFEARNIGKTATKIVDELYEKHARYSKVIDELKEDKVLEESVRKVALQIANSRLWEYEEQKIRENNE
jgi:WD40 repeat protein